MSVRKKEKTERCDAMFSEASLGPALYERGERTVVSTPVTVLGEYELVKPLGQGGDWEPYTGKAPDPRQACRPKNDHEAACRARERNREISSRGRSRGKTGPPKHCFHF